MSGEIGLSDMTVQLNFRLSSSDTKGQSYLCDNNFVYMKAEIYEEQKWRKFELN